MKRLVTGAGGFLGQAVVERLLALPNADLRCVVRSAAQAERLREKAAAHPGARLEVVTGNLLSRADVARAVDGIDVLYHLAASLKGSPADIFMNTVVASNNVLDALAGRPVTIVVVSSMGVYGTANLARGAVVDETTPLEPHPERRDVYSHAKWRQEKLFRDRCAHAGHRLIVIRPGVIYGPGGPPMSARVGLNLFGLFLHLGGGNRIPLTHVENCADAIVTVSENPDAVGHAFNVVDDDLPTSRAYLRRYRREVTRVRSVRIPYAGMLCVSRGVEWYHRHSRGQLPAVFTRYKTATLWKGTRFDNTKLKCIGWTPRVGTREGLTKSFAYLRAASKG
ncbi:MAG TPA: NAD(P)-dependent oxidoreductase [Candidatus Krumholzibacteria bacterium]|nr:NAD(P)-dependent oxidoreductase [Candidatus Krumholzibacteria bacterium]